MFKQKCMCMPKYSIVDFLDREAHEGGLMGHLGVSKTLETLQEHILFASCEN